MTQTVQHTPAPWRLDTPEPDGEIIVMDEQGVSIATCWKQPLDPSEWVEANALLIAAAPDMVEALEKGMASLKPEFDKYDAEKWHDAEARDAYIAMRAALAKAGIQ